jgi:hypothetical protein
MKSNRVLFTLVLLATSVITASAWPPGGFGPSWSFGRIPGGRNWRSTPSSGIFAGNVLLFYDANKDGKVDLKDTNKAYVAKKSLPPGLSLPRGRLLKVGFEAVSSAPVADEKTVRNPGYQDYKTVAGLEIAGINLMTRSGKFSTPEEERAACGRILVWLDASRSTLIMDSADVNRRSVVWYLSQGPVPQFLYVEAVSTGHSGGVFRLTASVDDSNQSYLMDKLFGRRTAYDHIIVNTGGH